MKGTTTSRTASFLVAAGTVGIAAALNRACPGQCASCSTCATTLVPLASAAGAVGVSFVGSAFVRSRGLPGVRPSAEEPASGLGDL